MPYLIEAPVWNDMGPLASLTKQIEADDPDAAIAQAREELDRVMADTGDPHMRYRITSVRKV